ncbi:MAG: hypothetical protein QGH72_06595, partial [Dehalococcoidia bacterium]|nr:hypothetical protein [Dehalococcoidia bacterium]
MDREARLEMLPHSLRDRPTAHIDPGKSQGTTGSGGLLDTPGGMNIQTIHAFCQSLLGRFPLEADVAPHFALMDERDAEEMLIAA